MENLNPLYAYLKSSAPLLIGDRSISTYGRRLLKGLRTYHSKWPLPGIYLPTELAEKILQKASLLKKQTTDWELFSFIAAERSEQNLDEVFDDFTQAKNLRKLLNYSQAAQLLTNEEISEKSHGVLYTLLLFQKFSTQEDKYAHSFDLLEDACETLEAEELHLDFHTPEDPQEFCFIGFRELYPAEEKFLQLLEKKHKRINISDSLDPKEKKHEFAFAEIEEVKQLLWVSELKPPAPLEAQLLSGSAKPLRLAVPSDLRHSTPHLDKILSSWPDSSEWLDQSIEQIKSPTEKKLLSRIRNEKLSSGPKILQSLSFFQRVDLGLENQERPLPLSLNFNDTLLVTLEDIPLINPGQTALWAKPDKIKEVVSDFCSALDPLKNFKDLEKHILGEGIAIPRVEEEQKNFEKYFYSFTAAFKVLKQKKSPEWEQVPNLEIKSKNISTRLSPSALESLYKCPLSFHFGREERIEQFEDADSLDISPIRRGNWIHYTMEILPWSKPEKITQELIKKALKEKLPKAFDKNASPSYQNILLAQTDAMAEALYHYVMAIDIPIAQCFPARKSQAEKEITAALEIDGKKTTLMGRVDRLDFVGDGALLWDYKNGNFSMSKLSKHLEDGSFQWLLYREIFHKDGTPIHGGGYINPLNLKKSRLFFFEGAPMPETFYDNLEKHEIKFERINSEEEKFLRNSLNEKVEKLIKIWNSGQREARPLDSSICDYCSYVGRCGHPYGVTP